MSFPPLFPTVAPRAHAVLVGLLWAVLPLAVNGQSRPAPEARDAFFERRVRPLLARRCYACHSKAQKKSQGELTLDTADGIRQGGERGPLLVEGAPEQSRLVRAVRYEDSELQMPPSGRLPEEEVQILVEWVRQGGTVPDYAAAEPEEPLWSLHPLQSPLPPAVRRADWPRARIDAFVLAQLEARELAPSDEVDRRSWLIRASYDLTGLPPAAEEISEFLNDSAPDAYGRRLDLLLASPRYGERWGRFWLDLARYTDTTATWLKSTAQAWRYRDWVISALNADLPYDDFVRRQLATDLISGTGPEDLPALGFLGLSPTYWKELRLAPSVIRQVVAEEWDERIDAVSRSFLGLTVACARCHDHKFDPIAMEDYYALAGVFASTQLADLPLLPPAESQALRAAWDQVAAREAELKQLGNTKSPRAQELRDEIERIKRETPHYDAPAANGVVEASVFVVADGPDKTKLVYHTGETRDLPVFRRGNPDNHGRQVRRRFLGVFSDPEPVPFEQGSGRLELAESILREGRPLSARVIVNRVWQQHFGRGLVATPSNFGRNGERPTHPRLLDDLAVRFVEHGWSLKWLHREIMLSATYRQASVYRTDAQARDPRNRWLWRMPRRRLDIEMWRDTLLAASGELDLRMGGPPLELGDMKNGRRTVYGKIGRRELDDMLRLYDFPTPTAHSPAREQTTTPLQQLFVLNSDFMARRAERLVARLFAEAEGREARVQRAYHILFGRAPREDERRQGARFLAEAGTTPDAMRRRWQLYIHALMGLNELMFVD